MPLSSAFLFSLSFYGCPILAVCFTSQVVPVLPQLSSPSCPSPAFLPCCPVTAILARLSCPACPASPVPPPCPGWSCNGNGWSCHNLPLLSWHKFSYLFYHVMAILSFSLVRAILSRLSFPGCPVRGKLCCSVTTTPQTRTMMLMNSPFKKLLHVDVHYVLHLSQYIISFQSIVISTRTSLVIRVIVVYIVDTCLCNCKNSLRIICILDRICVRFFVELTD